MELKIITFNIWDLHIGFVKDRQIRFKGLINKILELDADVVCLQESWDVEHQYELRKRLTPKYYTTLGDGKIPARHILWKKFDASGGLVILSKFPIEKWEFTLFTRWPNPSLIEVFAKKGFLSTTVGTPAGPLKIITTHLQAIHGKSDIAIQKRQFEELISGTNPNSQKTPLIIAGDFNKDKIMSDAFYATVASKNGFVESASLSGTGEVPTYRSKAENIYAGSFLHPAKKPLQFDYFLLENFVNLKSVWTKPMYFEPPLSDHDPLELTLFLG